MAATVSRDQHGRRRLIIAAAAAVSLLAPALVAAVVGARSVEAGVIADVQRAELDLGRGQQQLEEGYRRQDRGLTTEAFSSFARSRDRLQAVARRARAVQAATGPLSPGVVRDRLLTLDAVIDTGTHLDHAGMTAAQALLISGLVGSETDAPSQASGWLTTQLGSIRDELSAARRSAAGIDLTVLPSGARPALSRALDQLGTAVKALDTLWPSLGAVLDLLGLNGPRTYLVEQVNPAELRAGGGFIGTVSLVHAEGGRVTLARSLPVEAFDYCDAAGCVHPRPLPWQPGYVAPPAELTGYPLPPWSRLTAWSLEDSGFFPDFATSATTAERFARQLLGADVNGVLAVDYYAVAPLLGLTGPVALPQYQLTLTEANFVDTVVGLDLARDPAHKDVISAAADHVVADLSHLRPADLPRLVAIVEDQVRGRHLQVHFDNPEVQRQAGRLGASDALNSTRLSDFLLETEDNYGGSKANFFLDRSFRLDLSLIGSRLRHSLTVDLHDRAPADRPWIGPDYSAYLRVTVPGTATGVAMESAPSTEYAPIQAPFRRSQVDPPGSQVVGGWIFITVGEGLSGRYQATFTWETPWAPGPAGSDYLYWQKQPGTVHDSVQITWNSGAGTYAVSGDLSGDRLVELRREGLTIAPAV
jgi:hypothetical protein